MALEVCVQSEEYRGLLRIFCPLERNDPCVNQRGRDDSDVATAVNFGVGSLSSWFKSTCNWKRLRENQKK
jgi:hypothetical protein